MSSSTLLRSKTLNTDRTRNEAKNRSWTFGMRSLEYLLPIKYHQFHKLTVHIKLIENIRYRI